MILARATWTEVEALDREQVVVIPIGGTEQHGPCLPLGTSTFLADALANALNERLGNELLLVPTVPYCVSGQEKAFAGTVDLGYEALIATLRAVVAALVRHRFRRFLLVVANSGETNAAVQLALRALKDQHPTFQFAKISAGGSPQMRGEMLMAIAPHLVREPKTLPTIAFALPPRGYDAFVTDTEERSAGGLRLVSHEDAHENGAERLPRQVELAVELIATMRTGRVYVEEEAPA